MIKVLDNEAFLYHPLTIFMLISFVIAHIRVHSGLNWPNSSFDLYNTKLTKNKINYHALQLISNDNGNNGKVSDSIGEAAGLKSTHI